MRTVKPNSTQPDAPTGNIKLGAKQNVTTMPNNPSQPAKPSLPAVVQLHWKNDFTMAVVLERGIRIPAHRSIKYTVPIEKDGQRWPWGVEHVELEPDGKTMRGLIERRLFKTKADAETALKKWVAEFAAEQAKGEKILKEAATQKPSTDEEDLHKARQKVLREEHPSTFEARDIQAQAPPKARSETAEKTLKALTVDLVRLYKPTKIDSIKHFQGDLNATALIREIARADAAKSPFDAVDHELAANWFAAGYDRMSCDEYTQAINAKMGTKIKPKAMERRRYKKLELMTKEVGGAPPKV